MIELAKINIVTGYNIEQIRYFAERICTGGSVFIDETEIPLHPIEQAERADILVWSVEGAAGVVCTFSEELIMRLRRRIAEGKLDPQNVKLFLIEREHSGLEHKEFTFNEYGDFVCDRGWPLDFFKTCYDDVCAINRARRKKEENNEC